MAAKQESLIYIDKDNITEAEFMSKSFVNKEVKNRAYINALGAELVMKYIASEGINTEEIHNIHSISKVLEKIDIADILLPNIHIDARVIFDEKQIFIPKTHFSLEITPDIYVVLKLDPKFDHVELLGYFKPSQINKQNENSDYYFISKNKLSSPETLTKFIKDFTGQTSRKISQEDILRGRELSITLADHNITDDEFREFLELLLLNDTLRESVLEFDNFETLAYNVASELSRTQTIEPLQTSDQNESQNEEHNENLNLESEENVTNEEITLTDMNLGDDDILLDESFFDSDNDYTSSQEETLDELNHNQDNTDILPNTESTITEPSEDQMNEQLGESDLNIEKTMEQTNIQEDDIQKNITDDNIANFNDEQDDLGEDLLNNEIDIKTDEINIQDNEPVLDIDTTSAENSITLMDESIDLGDSLLEDNLNIEETYLSNENQQNTLQEEPLPLLNDEPSDLGDDLLNDDITTIESDIIEEATTTIEEDAVNPNTDATNSNNTEEPSSDTEKTSTNLAESITNALKDSLSETTTAATGAMATEKASAEAIKLASVAGDLVNDIVNKNIEQQQQNLDRIDYAKTTTDATSVPEHISALAHDLAAAKLEVNLEAEESGQFDTPKDLSDLKPIENVHQEVDFEQETIELGNMETVQTEEFTEDTGSIVNLENLANIDSPTKPVENLEERIKEPEIEKMDLPNLSSFEINEDGTSSFDNFATDINFNNDEEHLVDFGMPSNEIKIEDNDPIDFNISANESDITLDNTILETQDTLFDETPEISENLSLNDTITETDLTSDSVFETSTPQDEIQITEEPLITNSESEMVTSQEEISQPKSEYSDLDMADISELLSDSDNTDMDISSEIPEQQEHVQNMEISDDNIEIPDEINQEQTATEHDWMGDTNYDNLQDVTVEHNEQINPATEIPDEELISEPEENNQKTFAVKENSTVISDRTFSVGEIPIDINNPNIQQFNGENESLEDLYDPETKVPGASLLQTPGRLGSSSGGTKAGLGIGIKIIGGLIVLAIVCAIGFGVAKLFKTPTEEAPQPITDETTPTSPDNGVSEANTLNVNPDNVVKMDNNTNALATTQTTSTKKSAQPTAASTTNQTTSLSPAQKKSIAATTFIEVKRLSWEVPDYISYNSQFKQYFQAAGKSLKLSLTSDLLLATDYAYSNEIRVSVTFDKDGTFKNAQIVTSSGSTQIDNIVLQTVNQTLKVLKAPHSVGNDESTTAILKIYL